MARKSKYVPKAFESIGGNNLSAIIYVSMLQSKAWMQLSKNARLLYLYMKAQYYGARNLPERPNTDFVFNWALVSKTYKLYTNYQRFENDRNMQDSLLGPESTNGCRLSSSVTPSVNMVVQEY